MSFEEKNGIFEVKLNNGDVVRFESAEEMAAAKEYDESIQKLLGHVVDRPVAAPPVFGEKKKVRINIDPETEYVLGDNPSAGRSDTSPRVPRDESNESWGGSTKEAKRKVLV